MNEKITDVINGLLRGEKRPQEETYPFAFYVHASIKEKWDKIMNNWFTTGEWEMCEHKLQIGNKSYDMFLIIISRTTGEVNRVLLDTISISQFSFPWEDNPTLFIDAGSFNIMEIFLRQNNLSAYILTSDEKPGISADDGNIKVVSFNQSVNSKFNLIDKYSNYLFGYRRPQYYFVTHSFPWQHSHWLHKVHIQDDIYSVLPIILLHLGAFNTSALNIIDLITLRFALSDIRDQNPLNLSVLYELDFMIKRQLGKYVKNHHLDIDSHLVDKNCKILGFTFYYLIYEYQHFFDTVNIYSEYCPNPYGPYRHRNIKLVLAEDRNFSKTIKENTSIGYEIDGRGFDQMSLPIFLDLVDCHNVRDITLDTNYRWHQNVCQPSSVLTKREDKMWVHLVGENPYQFIEDFIAALKTVTIESSLVLIVRKTTLNDYNIFDDLTVSEILFMDLKIDTNMLDSFHRCNFQGVVSLFDCTLENTIRTWALLNMCNLHLQFVNLQEDEGTWKSLFEFVYSEMQKFNLKEYKFTGGLSSVGIMCEPGPWGVGLRSFKCTIDDQMSKLELRDIENNELLDLFNLKTWPKPAENPDYEFYQ